MIVAESIFLSLAGGATGVILALVVLEAKRLAVGAEGVMMTIRPTLNLTFVALGVSLLAGALAGIVPAVQAARMDIVAALCR